MSTQTLNQPVPATMPPAHPATVVPSETEPEMVFTPSPELGNQLEHLAEAQAEIDRKKAEELARLREIQNRD